MKFAFNMILAATFVSSAAMAAAPQDVTNATVRFNTNVARPVPSFTLIPAVQIGSSSFSEYALHELTPTNTSLSAATSYEAGVLAEFGRKTLVFQTGLMFITENFKSEAKSLNPTGMNTQLNQSGNFSYLGIPIALKARVRVSEGFRIAGRIGVMPALLTSKKLDYTSTVTNEFGQTLSTESGSSPGDAIRSEQVFAMIGGGPEFRINQVQNVRLEALYERMLMNMSTADGANISMQSIGAMLSYGVGF